jgi:hypothetical protein
MANKEFGYFYFFRNKIALKKIPIVGGKIFKVLCLYFEMI